MARYSEHSVVVVRHSSLAAGFLIFSVLLVVGGLIFAAFMGMLMDEQRDAENSSEVTLARAQAHLDRIVAAGRAGDLDTVCGLSNSSDTCRRQLQTAGRRAPATPPCVAGALFEGAGETASVVLFVQGTTRAGRPYRTQVRVSRDAKEQLEATNAVYWSGASVVAKNVKPTMNWGYLCGN